MIALTNNALTQLHLKELRSNDSIDSTISDFGDHANEEIENFITLKLTKYEENVRFMAFSWKANAIRNELTQQ